MGTAVSRVESGTTQTVCRRRRQYRDTRDTGPVLVGCQSSRQPSPFFPVPYSSLFMIPGRTFRFASDYWHQVTVFHDEIAQKSGAILVKRGFFSSDPISRQGYGRLCQIRNYNLFPLNTGKFESKNLTARFISGNPGLSWRGRKNIAVWRMGIVADCL